MKTIILILLIVGIAYLMANLNISTEVPSLTITPTEKTTSDTPPEDKHPLLNEVQEKALETIGIDPASVPSSISPEQEQCFVDALGQKRVDEIKAGAAPTPADLFTARNCVQL